MRYVTIIATFASLLFVQIDATAASPAASNNKQAQATSSAPMTAQASPTNAHQTAGHAESQAGTASQSKKPRWLLNTLSGEPIDLEQRIQQPQNRIMIFWATWCPYCKQLLPIVEKIKNDYPELEVLAFNVFDDLAVEDYAEKAPWPFVHVLGGDEFARAHGVKGLPTLFLLNDKGRMVLDLREIDTTGGNAGKSNRAKAAHHAPLWDKGLRDALDKLEWQ